VSDPPSEELALRFEAALFEDLRRTVRHMDTRHIKMERLSLVGWPPDTQVAVVFDTGSSLVERMLPIWVIDRPREPMNVISFSTSIWAEIEKMLTSGFP
jgi:hypothetical protein